MFLWLILLFTILPVVELSLLIQVGSEIGVASTISVVLITGIVGAWLARQEGMRTMARMQEQLARGEMPAEELVDGFLILFAGAVLLTPGFVTDLWGLLILLPPTRKIFKHVVKQRLERNMLIYQQGFGSGEAPTSPFEVIDVTEIDMDDEEDERTLH